MEDAMNTNGMVAYQAKSPSATSSTGSGGRGREETPERSSQKARRGFLTQNACNRCRQKKSKCDGRRPICSRCDQNNADCMYDIAEEGVTRMQNLQRRLDNKTEEHRQLQAFVGALQTQCDQVAAGLLARLRLGESVAELERLGSRMNASQQAERSGVPHAASTRTYSTEMRQLMWTMHANGFSDDPRASTVDGEHDSSGQRPSSGRVPASSDARHRPLHAPARNTPQQRRPSEDVMMQTWPPYSPDGVASNYDPQITRMPQTISQSREMNMSDDEGYYPGQRKPP